MGMINQTVGKFKRRGTIGKRRGTPRIRYELMKWWTKFSVVATSSRLKLFKHPLTGVPYQVGNRYKESESGSFFHIKLFKCLIP